MHAVIAVAVSYLLGSISFGLVLARLRGVDLRSTGSGNVGATNAARAMGKRWGVLVMVLDALKAVVPLLVGASLFAQDPARDTILAAMATAAFLGHLYPVFHGFAGGKGVATAFGIFLTLEPKAALLGFVTYALAYGLSRISSVGSLLAALLFPLWLFLTHARPTSYYLAVGLLLMIVLKHRSNIARLLARSESKL